jgi:hypothetical protein
MSLPPALPLLRAVSHSIVFLRHLQHSPNFTPIVALFAFAVGAGTPALWIFDRVMHCTG